MNHPRKGIRPPVGIQRATPGLLAILAFVAAVYLSTMSVNHSEAEDSLFLLKTISHEALSEQFHPHHLLYNFLNYLLFHTCQIFGYTGNAETPVITLNVVASLSALFVLYLISARLGLASWTMYSIIIAVAFSFGFWWYSVECETYMIPIVFVLLTIHRMMCLERDFCRCANHVLLGIFNGMAILFHQQHVLLCFPVSVGYIYLFYSRRRERTLKMLLRGVSLYSIGCSSLVVLCYLCAVVIVKGLTDFQEISDWLSGYAFTDYWGFWAAASPMKAVIGFSRSLIGGHYLFSFPAVSSFIQKAFPHYVLREEVFLVHGFSAARRTVLLILTAAVSISASFIIVQTVKHGVPKAIEGEGPRASMSRLILLLSAAYIVIYSAFNAWWEPLNVEFWVSVIPFVFLFLGLLIDPILHKRGIRTSLCVFLTCLFLVNLQGSVLPQTDRQYDYWYNFNAWFIENCRPGDLVVSGSGIISDSYVEYYTGARVASVVVLESVLKTDQSLEERIAEMIDSENPKRVFFSSTLKEIPREVADKFDIDASSVRALFELYRPRLSIVHEDEYQTIFLYRELVESKTGLTTESEKAIQDRTRVKYRQPWV